MDWVKLLLLNTPETTLSVDAFPEVAGQLSVGFRCLNLFSFAYSRNTLKHTMSSNNMADPRRQNKILRYKPPSTETNPTLEDPTPDYMNLLGMIFSMCGLMLKLKWCAWIAVYCSFISFANSRSSEDTKQMMSSFITHSQCHRHGNQGPISGESRS
uniref:PAT complex subunit Asterix n=1 Tax=Astatotilapia calliptera TaxID=8154 RepID=A0AAX7USJ3_ASTCA